MRLTLPSELQALASRQDSKRWAVLLTRYSDLFLQTDQGTLSGTETGKQKSLPIMQI